MQNSDNTPFQSSNNKSKELLAVYLAFMKSPKTMKEVDIETGIMRESICWYCRTLRQQNKLFKVGIRKCKVTKHSAATWTTNPEINPNNIQLKLL